MRLQDLNWMDVEKYLEHDNRIILSTGATEQHAYLSVMTDILIASKIAEAVGKRERVLVAPPLNFGVSYLFGEFPGTISLSQQTFEYVVLEIVESLFHQGFRRFFIVNGHGGNHLPERLADFEMEGIVRVKWFDWYTGQAAQKFCTEHDLTIEHANWGENFPFNRVAQSPDAAKQPVNEDLLNSVERYSVRDVVGDGNFGGLYQIEDTLMYMLFDAVVDEASELLRNLQDIKME